MDSDDWPPKAGLWELAVSALLLIALWGGIVMVVLWLFRLTCNFLGLTP